MEVPISGPLRIILLDDDFGFGKTTSLQLKNQGYESVSFHRSLAFQEYLRTNFADVIMLDYHLPVTSGAAVCEIIRKMPGCAGLLMFIVTADSSPLTLQKCVEVDVDGFFLKPLDLPRLIGIIQDHRPQIMLRREIEFFRHFMDIFLRDDIPAGRRTRLTRELQQTGMFRKFVDDPATVPEEQRHLLARILRAFYRDLGQRMRDSYPGPDADDDEKILRTLEVIDQVGDPQSQDLWLQALIRSQNEKLASKAAKILGKTAADAHAIVNTLDRHDDRFAANFLESLWNISNTRTALEIFRIYIKSDVPRVKTNCLVGLYLFSQKDEALAEFRRMLASDDEREVRSALWACGFVRAREIRSEVLALASYPIEDLRQRAERTLALMDQEL